MAAEAKSILEDLEVQVVRASGFGPLLVQDEKLYENPTEVIDLKVFTSVKSSKEYTNKTNSFDIYSKEMAFSLLAKSAEEKEDWIRAIGKAIVMSRNNLTFDRQDSDSD
eukprot:CAMPEP_0197527566 /NCGR_PEP_ID=MMETSP1318-20131121/22146_1 /TAXON_ID=552666 /ORGANISM="Partenskyella glossopodia, Strain RCC365" /LENGTH=108 /DNA_ID=CAMNT_0043082289 /DNA_START=83 /DNA_END=410 /DNA_ORIENTATION=-